MKRRLKLHLIIYTVAAGLFTACENEIPFNLGEQKPMLIMNAMLDAEATENIVSLYLSEGGGIRYINEATLSLYVNNKQAETLQPISAEEHYGHMKDQVSNEIYEALLKSIHFKKFRLTTALKPGDNIRLEATAEGGKYHVYSEVTVPQPLQSLQVDTATALIRNWGSMRYFRQYRITLQDYPNEKNYYRLEIVNNKDFRCITRTPLEDERGNYIKDENGDYIYTISKDTVINYRFGELINREDVILTDGHVTSSEDDENAMFPAIENKYNVFTDNRFSNSSATLKVYTPLYDDNYGIITNLEYTRCYLKHTIIVRLISLPEIYYRYLQALNCLDDDDYDSALMEPISMPGNVVGGLGFVGVSSEIKYTIEMPEKEWKWW